MTPEERFKKLADRRAEKNVPNQVVDIYVSHTNISATFRRTSTHKVFLSGALDPVLEEARRCMARAEAFETVLNSCRVSYNKLRSDKTSEFGDGCAGTYARIISDLKLLMQLESKKLEKLLAEPQ